MLFRVSVGVKVVFVATELMLIFEVWNLDDSVLKCKENVNVY